MPPLLRRSLRVLIVEDEYLIALDLADMLREAGHEVVAIAPSLSTATEHLAAGGIDLVVVDGLLHRETSQPLVQRLREDGMPIVLASALDASQLGPWASGLTRVGKPFTTCRLACALEEARGTRSEPAAL